MSHTTQTCTHLHLYQPYLENHEFTPVPPIPIITMGLIQVFSLSIFVSFFPNSKIIIIIFKKFTYLNTPSVCGHTYRSLYPCHLPTADILLTPQGFWEPVLGHALHPPQRGCQHSMWKCSFGETKILPFFQGVYILMVGKGEQRNKK